MSAGDDWEDVHRADRFLSASPDRDEDGWAEIGPVLAAARQPAGGDELVGVDATIELFTSTLHDSAPVRRPRKSVLRKVAAGVAFASVITAGAAAAATGHLN